MYAVIASGGKQYRVAEGETLRVEKLAGPAGTKVTFGPLLFADDGGGVQVGQPTVSGITVEAEIVEQGLGKKIVIFKYKRRKSYRRKTGHRQPFTALKITAIRAGAAEAKA
ncbi:MAG TPA: 50S ribosomal protein L21 [Polyangia bacterium]|nr:50S ribosomal protein L21 [Polyangia bacterium]